MAVILNSGSSVALTTGTETTLTQIGTPGRFQLVADLTNYQNGDAIQFRVKMMANAGGTARTVENMMYYGQQFTDDMVKESSIHNNDQSDAQALVFTATQIAGTSRTLIWKVVQVDADSTNQQVVVVSGTVTDVRNVVRANLIQIDGAATSGTNANLNLNSLNIKSSGTNAVKIANSTAHSPLYVQGSPSFGVAGVVVEGGVEAIRLLGGQAGNGDGILIEPQGTGHGLDIVPFGSGDAISLWPTGPSGAAIRVNEGDGSNLGFVGNIVGNISGSIYGNLRGFVGQVTGSVMSVVSGTAASFDPSTVWSFTGSRSLNGLQQFNISGTITNVYNVLNDVHVSGTVLVNDVHVSGTVLASAVQGGLVTVSGAVVADVRSLVGVSGTVLASAVQGGFVTVSGTVNLASPQVVNFIGNISGTVTNNYLREQEIETMIGLLKEDERAIMGNIYYVDGTRGNDVSGDGTRANPFKTITRALIPVTSHNHDAIFLLPVPTGTNTVTETGTVNITKSDVSIYGPGYDVLVTNIPANNRDVFNITAEGVSLHQFRVAATGNSSNGVVFSGGAALGLVSHLWLESIPQDAIYINVGNRNRILNSHINSAGRDAIRINSGAGSGTYNYIQDNVMRNNIGNGINLLGTDASNTIIQRNIIRDNIGFGISIAAGTVNTLLTDNRLINNTAGNISDAGTNTMQQWNFFNTDTVGIPLAVYNLVSGSVIADRVWQYTGTRIVDNVRGLVGVSGTVVASAVQGGTVTVSGTVLASAVQGGYVTVSGAVVADVRSLVGVSGTVLASAVQSLVGVSGTVVASAVQGGYVTVSGSVDAVRGGFVTVSGAVVADVRSLVGVSGTVLASAVQGGFVTVSGAVTLQPNQVVIASAVQGGYVTVSGTVVVSSGTVNTVFNLVSGTPASVDPATIWNYTGSRALNVDQNWNLRGFVGMVTGSAMSLVSGSAAAIDYASIWNYTGTKIVDAVKGGFVNASGVSVNIDYSQIWSYTGSRTVDAVKGGYVTVSGAVVADVRSLVGISGTVLASAVQGGYVTASGVSTIDYSQVWSYTGSKVVDAVKGGYVSVSGTVVVSSGTVNTVFNVVSGTAAQIDPSQIWGFTGSRSLNGQQYWNLSGSIAPGQAISLTVTGVTIDAASVWGYATRTLTDQVFNLPPVEQGNNLNIRRGDTFSWSPTNLGSLANLSKLYFTVKRLYTDLDTESEIQVEKAAGLLYINRAPAAVAAHGSIVVNDANLGNITITVDAVETAKLDLLTDVYYDVQFINASGVVTTLVSGLVTIEGDATRGTA